MRRRALLAGAALLLLACGLLASVVRHELRPLEGAQRLEIMPAVTAIAAGRTYAYLVEANDGLVLVDAGSDVTGRALLDELQRRGKTEADVRAILLTSAHPDLLAAAHLFPNATLYAGPEDDLLVQGERFPSAPLARVLGRWFVRRKRAQRIVPVIAGARLVVLGTTFEAVAIPGVTRGGRAWVSGGVALVGLGVEVQGDAAQLPSRLMAERPGDLRRSLPRLAALTFERVAAARGVVARTSLSAWLDAPR